MEQWREIKEFEGIYEVSNEGRVRSIERDVVKKTGVIQRRKGCIMQGSTEKRGYKRVSLMKNGKTYNRSKHRLVAQAFIPNPENKPEVNHIDGDKANNNKENLEWATPSENKQHAFDTGLRDNSKFMKPIACKELGIETKSIVGMAIHLNENNIIQRDVETIRGGIKAVLGGKNKHAYGFTFEYVQKETL